MADEKRLIDANACCDKCGMRNYECCSFCIVGTAPTVEAVEVVHGRWIDITYADVQCSVCGFKWFAVCQECGVTPDNTHYCPNCGADMRGDGNV